MPSEEQVNRGYLLPEEPETPERICVQLQIPNDQNHIRAFWGALQELSYWWNWERDSEHTARLAAKVWRYVVLDASRVFYSSGFECQELALFNVRQNSENPCLLEKTIDGGDTWVTFANLNLCLPKIRRNPSNGNFELSTDGIDWFVVDDGPWVEPFAPYVPPPNVRTEDTGSLRKCAAAATATEVLRLTYKEIGEGLLEDTITAPALILSASGILFALLGIEATIPIWVGTAAGIISFSAAYGNQPWTTEVADEITCILYANSQDDGAGNVTFDLAGVQADLTDKFNEDILTNQAYGLTSILLDFLGADGLNLAGSVDAGIAGDCDECEQPPDILWTFQTTPEHLGYWSGGEVVNPGVILFSYPEAIQVDSEAGSPELPAPVGYVLKSVDLHIHSTAQFETMRLTVDGQSLEIGAVDQKHTWDLQGLGLIGTVFVFEFVSQGTYQVNQCNVIWEVE